MAGDVEELRPRVALAPEAGEPGAAAPADGGGHGHRLHVGHRGGAAENTCKWSGLSTTASLWWDSSQALPKVTASGLFGGELGFVLPRLAHRELRGTWGRTHISRERRLQAGLALLALDGLDQRRLLPADVSPSAPHHKDVEGVPRATGVLPQQPGLVRLPDGHLRRGQRVGTGGTHRRKRPAGPLAAHLQVGGLIVELSSDVDVGGAGAHGTAGHQAALHQLVGVVAHDLPVLAGARFPLVRVHHQVFGPVGKRRQPPVPALWVRAVPVPVPTCHPGACS